MGFIQTKLFLHIIILLLLLLHSSSSSSGILILTDKVRNSGKLKRELTSSFYKYTTTNRLAGPDCKTGLDRTGLLTKQSGPVHGPESQFPVCNLFSDRTAVCQNAFRPDCGLEINFSDRKIYY